MLMCVYRITLGRDRVFWLMVISPAEQLFLNNAFLYLNAVFELFVLILSVNGAKKLSFIVFIVSIVLKVLIVSPLTQQLESIAR